MTEVSPAAPVSASVSVVVATHNAALTLERCLASVFSQDTAVELVVVDGASSDGTADVLVHHSDRIAWWVSEPDRGLYDAWNKAIPHASGRWLIFIGADDELAAPDVMSRVASRLAGAEGRFRVVYGSIELTDGDDGITGSSGRPWAEAGPRFPFEMSVPHPATFHHRDLFAEHGLFDPRYRIAGDYEFLLRELPDHEALFIPDLVVTRMAAGGISDDPRTMARHVREAHRARYVHGLVGTPDWRSLEVFRATTHARLTRWFGRDAADRVGDAYRALTRTTRKQP